MIPTSEHRHDDVIAPCLACASPEGWMAPPMPSVDDPEGLAVPRDLPPVVDAHVHVFPERVFEALWRWFDNYGWPIRYKLHAKEVLSFLFSRGVTRVVTLLYAHKPGMARALNRFAAELAAGDPRVVPLGTVLPGEPDAAAIVEEAFDLGLRGIKLHCHVQVFAPDGEQLQEVYEVCQRRGRPIVIHAGREPKSAKYKIDPYALCSADRIERVLTQFPRLKLCVPHLGADELDAYARLLSRHQNLWLDTTMALARYFEMPVPMSMIERGEGRVLYGTDFPNLPYAWDRELGHILEASLPPDVLADLLGGAAGRLYDLTSDAVARPAPSLGG